MKIIWQFCSLAPLLLTLCLPAYANDRARIRKVDFRNLIFPFTARASRDLPARISVRHGMYHSPHQEPSLSFTYIKVADVVYGDLTGDGREEAAVVAIYGSASSDLYSASIYVYGLSGPRLKLLAILNQDEVAAEYERYSHEGRSSLFEAVSGGTRIKNGVLAVRYFAGGGHCCPSNVFSVKYRLKKGGLVIVGRALRKRTEAEARIAHGAGDR